MNYPSDIAAGYRSYGDPQDEPDWDVIKESWAEAVLPRFGLYGRMAENMAEEMREVMDGLDFPMADYRQLIENWIRTYANQRTDLAEWGAALGLWPSFEDWYEVKR